MKKTILLIIWITLYCFNHNVHSQKKHEGLTIECPYNNQSSGLRIPVPGEYWKYKNLSSSRLSNSPKNAEFIVTYVGFENFPQAQAAYQFAVDIWSSLLYSDVPIYLRAGFGGLDAGILAQAGPGALYSDFQGAINDTTIYHVAMAEKMARRDLNEPGEFDIVATFSNTQNWYFGTDGNVPSNQFEFVATVLHEIGHGLGFSSLDNVGGSPSIGLVSPGAYTNYIVNGSGISIYAVENNSTAMASYLQSDNLFINSSGARAVNENQAPEIYAPTSYNGGSSISHLGEVFNNTENACMTFSGSPGESILDPGPIVTRFFYDLGWLGSTLLHEENVIIEGLNEDLVFELDFRSDIGFQSRVDIPKFVYSFDNFQTSSDVELILSDEGKYSSTISNPGKNSSISYYFDGLSDTLRSYTLPSGTFKDDVILKPFSAVIVSSEAQNLSFTLENGGDFENEELFIPINLDGGLVNLWERGTPTNTLNTPSSGTNVWKTDLDDDITKPSKNIISGLLTPKFDLSDEIGNYTLSFDLSMDSDQGALFASVVYSTDGGDNWLQLGNENDGRGENWFNAEIPDGLGGGQGWSLNNSNDGSPLRASYNVSNLAGNQNVRFAIVALLSSEFREESYNIDGVMIDDFQLLIESPNAAFRNATDNTFIYPGDSVQFEFLSGGATSFDWDFGDGGTSIDKNPTHSYVSAGEYLVSLTIAYPDGSNSSSSSVTVTSLYGSDYKPSDGGDFETNSLDFYADNISGTGWERGNSNISGKDGTASGNFAWVTGISEPQYADQSEGFLYTPRFDFSRLGNYEISFKTNYDTESDWDGFIVEHTIDNGLTWNQLEPETADEWYDGLAVDNPEQGWPSIPIFSGSTNGEFVTKRRDISSLSGTRSVGFRFHWKSDFAFTVVGVAIDDFELKGPSGSVLVDFTSDVSALCSGSEVVFESAISGAINSLTWDFGINAEPKSATGIGPHTVTYYSEEEVKNTVKLTATSAGNEDVFEEKVEFLTVIPEFKPTITQNLEVLPVSLEASEGDSYQWFLNGEPISGEISRAIEVIKRGEYSVEVNISGCQNISDGITIDLLLTTNYLDKSVSIYPNPSDGEINIVFDQPGTHQLTVLIFTMTGQKLFSEEFTQFQSSKAKTLNLDFLSTGTYFMKITDENNTSTFKKLLFK